MFAGETQSAIGGTIFSSAAATASRFASKGKLFFEQTCNDAHENSLPQSDSSLNDNMNSFYKGNSPFHNRMNSAFSNKSSFRERNNSFREGNSSFYEGNSSFYDENSSLDKVNSSLHNGLLQAQKVNLLSLDKHQDE